MKFPNTPITIIEKLTEPNKREIWNGAWRSFFAIYHAPIKIMVMNSFFAKRWFDVPQSAIEDVISDVVVSLNKVFNENKFEIGRTKFRFFLKSICHNRAMDYMRKNFDAMKVERQTHYLNSDDDNFLDKNDNTEGGDLGIELEKSELLALQNSMLLDLYESVRKDFSPRACVAFEMVKLQGIPVREVSKELGMIPSDISQCIFKISKALKDTVIKHEIYKELKENDRSK